MHREPRIPTARRSSARRASMVSATAFSIATLLGTPSASASPVGPAVDAGDVTVIDTDGQPLIRGGSATEFGLLLPEGAACPGDSMHDQWAAQSFVVPATNDLGSLKYGVIGPEGEAQYALYMLNTNPYVDALTLSNDAPGKPGRITIPAFTFNEFPPGTLPDGRYRIGIACTYLERKIGLYWDTEIIVAAEADDEPGQMIWRLSDAPIELDEPDGASSVWIFVAAAVVITVAIGGIAARRRTVRHVTHSLKDPS